MRNRIILKTHNSNSFYYKIEGAVKKAPNKKDCDLAKKARQQSFFVV